MTRPQIVRADTLDLQDTDAPSAKDHTRQPTTPGALGEGPPAPHQAGALKSAGLDSLELRTRSPRASQDLSGKEIQLLQNHDETDETNETNLDDSGGGSQDEDLDDEANESSEDDMMDKISSSPSIDDGGLIFPCKHVPAQSVVPQGQRPGQENQGSSKGPTIVISRNSWTAFQPVVRSPLRQQWALDEDSEDLSEYGDDLQDGSVQLNQESALTSPDAVSLKDDEDEEYDSYASDGSSEIDYGAIRDINDLSEQLENIDYGDHFQWSVWLNLPLLAPPRTPQGYEELTIRTSQDIDSIASQGNSQAVRRIRRLSYNEGVFKFDPLVEYGEPYPVSDSDDELNEDDERDIRRLESKLIFNPEENPGDDDPYRAFSYEPLRRDLNSFCSRMTEDIDFEFVYALHTFVATVEGQANATKGDTMVLLDDSNSYWWLVRIVKDSSIGYLPAEHIETPTERLARLNKHRNIDLSQAMLGDNTEKSRSNPLRKARKRRNAKTVQFADNTYYEPSEREYSSDEDGSPDDMEFITTADAANGEHETDTTAEVNSVKEPIKAEEAPKENGHHDHTAVQVAAVGAGAGAAAIAAATVTATTASDSIKTVENPTRMSSDSIDDGSPKKTRIRNTDSFYNDNTIETKRINLTPSLLRESNNSGDAQQTSTPNRARSSSESTTKSSSSEKPPEKRKEKKSVLGRLFKAKNSKKAQAEEEAEEWIAKEPTEKQTSRSSAEASSLDTGTSTTITSKSSPARTGSKLTKAPPQKSNSFSKGSAKPAVVAPVVEPTLTAPQLETTATVSPLMNSFADDSEGFGSKLAASNTASSADGVVRSPSESRNRTLFTPIREVLSKTDSPEPRPEKVKKAPTREPIEFSDDSDVEVGRSRDIKGAVASKDRLSESPVHVPAVSNGFNHQIHPTETSRGIVNSITDDSGSSTPELIERPSQEMGASNASTGESSAPSSRKDNFDWTRLNAWFNNGEFNDWYNVLMDVSDEMKDFDWKKHWSYGLVKDDVEAHEETVEEIDWSLVDHYDIDTRKQKGLPPLHPAYRQFGWELQWMRHEHDSHKKGENPGWLPWNDPEYAYIYPHRPNPAGAASGPPQGYVRRPQHDLRIIGPSALTMNLDAVDPKSVSPYAEASSSAENESRVQADVNTAMKS